MTKEQECLQALFHLYLEVPSVIADDVKQKVINALDEVKNCIPNVSNRREQLIAYQLWCYQHPEHDQVCQSSKVDIYLKTINCC